MIESHKRLLLNGFYEEFGKLDVKNTDNIRVSLSEGAESAINAMVLASIAPWLSESLELEGAAVYMPGLATNSIMFPFCEKSLICLKGKSMTPHWGNSILFRSSQQLPCLRLGPSKGFLS